MVAPDLVSEEDIAKLIIPDDLPNDEPSFKAYIEAKVYDKDGHLIQYHRQPMRSLTQYFLALMSVPLAGTYVNSSTVQATGILTNVLGLPSTVTAYAVNGVGSTAMAWDWSIQLGSGTQAFSLSLNSLASPIPSTEISYSLLSVFYTTSSIIASVTVTNLTSNTLTVTEIGLFATVYLEYSNSNGNYAYSSYNFLLSYDTFSTAISIPANGMAVFQITISFSG
jgi:hypothetical protein